VRFGNCFCLRTRKQFDHRSGFEVPGRGDNSVLIDAGRNRQRFDSGCTKSREAGG
jgi:hypothetical protein